MYVYRASGDPVLLEMAVDMLEAIEHSSRTRCGYASVSASSHKPHSYSNYRLIAFVILVDRITSNLCERVARTSSRRKAFCY